MIDARHMTAAALAATLGLACLVAGPAQASDDATRYQGWGLAIAYLAVGEKCAGALGSEDMESLQSFIASGLAFSRQRDRKFDHNKFVDTFHDEMVAKYADARNCTPAVIKEARDAVADVRRRNADGK